MDWEQHDFYKILEIEPDAGAEEIEEAHRRLASALSPDEKPQEQRRAAMA